MTMLSRALAGALLLAAAGPAVESARCPHQERT